MTRAQRYTHELQKHDRHLFCRREADGFYKVYLKTKRCVTYDVDGTQIGFLVPDEKFILALSDNWSMRGKPVEWGLCPLMDKIRSIDAFNERAEIHGLEKQREKEDASKQRDFANKAEAFASDFRPQFAKAFNDFNTSTMKKIDNRRKKDGYRK